MRRATEKDKKKYLESRCEKIVEFQRTGRYLMYMKTKILGRKENQVFQNTVKFSRITLQKSAIELMDQKNPEIETEV